MLKFEKKIATNRWEWLKKNFSRSARKEIFVWKMKTPPPPFYSEMFVPIRSKIIVFLICFTVENNRFGQHFCFALPDNFETSMVNHPNI